ncbi:CRISPR-associated endonuclease Cas9 [subsurface metagenome]
MVKKKTEHDIEQSNKHVGTYIYDTLLQNPNQKIKGKLVRVIERKFYKEELKVILETQLQLHPELKDEKLYKACLNELYRHNDAHRQNIARRDFIYLFLDDIIFYQRPLKTKKSEISECRFESRTFIKDGKKETVGIKCIAKSHPLFQEFRVWQWVKNLKIYAKEKEVNGKLEIDVPVTELYLKSENDYEVLFEFLNERKEVNQKALLKHFGLNDKTHRWNFVEDKTYPCNETHAQILNRLVKVINVPADFLTRETEEHLWHILYSVNDKMEIEKALKSFAENHDLDVKSFSEVFRKFPPFKKEYGSYSAKAIKKLLPLMRIGKYWREDEMLRHIDSYHSNIKSVIDKLRSKTDSEKGINTSLLSKLENIDDDIESYKGLELHVACYAAYGKHSELTETRYWKTPNDIDKYLKEFKQHSLRNPIVEQVVTETLRTVRDIWQEMGKGH